MATPVPSSPAATGAAQKPPLPTAAWTMTAADLQDQSDTTRKPTCKPNLRIKRTAFTTDNDDGNFIALLREAMGKLSELVCPDAEWLLARNFGFFTIECVDAAGNPATAVTPTNRDALLRALQNNPPQLYHLSFGTFKPSATRPYIRATCGEVSDDAQLTIPPSAVFENDAQLDNEGLSDDAACAKLFTETIQGAPSGTFSYGIGPASSEVSALLDTVIRSGWLFSQQHVYEGISTPYIYLSSRRGSGSADHKEDGDLPSVNELVDGLPKDWMFIAPRYRKKFEAAMEKLARSQIVRKSANWTPRCSQWVRHLGVYVTPQWLDKHGIPFSFVRQRPGTVVVTLPGTYHQVLNEGPNIAVAVNCVDFTTESTTESDDVGRAGSSSYIYCSRRCGASDAEENLFTQSSMNGLAQCIDQTHRAVNIDWLPPSSNSPPPASSPPDNASQPGAPAKQLAASPAVSNADVDSADPSPARLHQPSTRSRGDRRSASASTVSSSSSGPDKPPPLTTTWNGSSDRSTSTPTVPTPTRTSAFSPLTTSTELEERGIETDASTLAPSMQAPPVAGRRESGLASSSRALALAMPGDPPRLGTRTTIHATTPSEAAAAAHEVTTSRPPPSSLTQQQSLEVMLLDRVHELQTALQAEREDHVRDTAELNAVKEELKTLKAVNEDLQTAKDTLSRANSNLAAEKQRHQADTANLNQRLESEQSLRADLQSRIDQITVLASGNGNNNNKRRHDHPTEEERPPRLSKRPRAAEDAGAGLGPALLGFLDALPGSSHPSNTNNPSRQPAGAPPSATTPTTPSPSTSTPIAHPPPPLAYPALSFPSAVQRLIDLSHAWARTQSPPDPRIPASGLSFPTSSTHTQVLQAIDSAQARGDSCPLSRFVRRVLKLHLALRQADLVESAAAHHRSSSSSPVVVVRKTTPKEASEPFKRALPSGTSEATLALWFKTGRKYVSLCGGRWEGPALVVPLPPPPPLHYHHAAAASCDIAEEEEEEVPPAADSRPSEAVWRRKWMLALVGRDVDARWDKSWSAAEWMAAGWERTPRMPALVRVAEWMVGEWEVGHGMPSARRVAERMKELEMEMEA